MTKSVEVHAIYRLRIKKLSAYETQTLSTYDDNGNVSQTKTKSWKEGETEWKSQTVKIDYDEQGQVIGQQKPSILMISVAILSWSKANWMERKHSMSMH